MNYRNLILRISSFLLIFGFFFAFFGTEVSAQTGSNLSVNTRFANPSKYQNIEEVISDVTSVIRPAFIIMFGAMILYAAVIITTARGNDEQVALAKKTLGGAFVGFGIAVFAPTVADLMLSILGVEGFGTLASGGTGGGGTR